MNGYRLYFVEDHGERRGAVEFASANDHAAKEAAKRLGCERGADLWCGSRLVSSWRLQGATSREWPGAWAARGRS